MFWHAMPPELNTARLMAGAGAAPMLQAAAGWEALAISLETQADELAASLASLTSVWSGSASERAVASTMPMVAWLRTVSAQAQKRALQAVAQANSYSLAMATTPPLPEIAANHVTRAVLHATNFLGINTVPIGINEFDYFERMWNQAAGAMDVYQAETAMNIMFEPIMPPKPIVIPGVGEGAAAAALGQAVAGAPGAAMRNAAIAHVGAQATVESAGLQTGRAVAQANQMAVHAEEQAQRTQNAGQPAPHQMQQGMQMGVQMASQLGSTVAQLPQQGMQLVTQPMQQLAQPLQQVTSMFGQLGSLGGEKAQMGLIGASPLSNHPLAGGTGAGAGAGLVRAASLPGAGGTAARTPLMAGLIGDTKPVAVAPGAAAGATTGGLAPVGAGAGGMGPAHAMGQRGVSGGSRQGLTAPSVLPQDLGENEDDDDW
ncbi:PPE family protein [Mycobacterium sp. IDR2000157661]|uniref:PPE family protein n=1 Tax=Mycobacterium sp. IDR2000157661 TaxID=2867005 RepID=UPI001EED8726|nr:PPE family protein [Mycobacterium sp. IDR2000157661]ULE34775.1 PPE family protein [Mycobacterium sp. IDR2000157661]